MAIKVALQTPITATDAEYRPWRFEIENPRNGKPTITLHVETWRINATGDPVDVKAAAAYSKSYAYDAAKDDQITVGANTYTLAQIVTALKKWADNKITENL